MYQIPKKLAIRGGKVVLKSYSIPKSSYRSSYRSPPDIQEPVFLNFNQFEVLFQKSNSLCIPVNLDNLLKNSFDVFTSNIFSYPKLSFEEFIKNSNIQPFLYEPIFVVIATIEEDFQNSTGSFFYQMDFSKVGLVFSAQGEVITKKLSQIRFDNYEDYQTNKKILIKEGISVKENIQQINVKKAVQRACSVNARYTGQNYVSYNRICRPKLTNIKIHQVIKCQQLLAKIALKLENTIFEIKIGNDTINHLECVDFPTKKITPREVRMCNKCCCLIFKGAPKKKFISCRECGMILCKDCTIEENWCHECAKSQTDRSKKNKEAHKTLKKEFHQWKRTKKLVKLQFVKT
ncbi:MAG: hypothetical protein KJI71_02535 [Patescibacteria group bacterium]|nr:hypothetical protein [Patescibacteria group bacterium]